MLSAHVLLVRLSDQTSLFFSQTGAGYYWAKGYHTEGVELVDSVMDGVE